MAGQLKFSWMLIVAMYIVEREGLDAIVGCKVCGKVQANHPQLPHIAIVRMRGVYGFAPGAHTWTAHEQLKLC